MKNRYVKMELAIKIYIVIGFRGKKLVNIIIIITPAADIHGITWVAKIIKKRFNSMGNDSLR
jgi:hypothetical protein